MLRHMLIVGSLATLLGCGPSGGKDTADAGLEACTADVKEACEPGSLSTCLNGQWACTCPPATEMVCPNTGVISTCDGGVWGPCPSGP